MKHYALHIEGLIDRQSRNAGRAPTASRCAFCSWVGSKPTDTPSVGVSDNAPAPAIALNQDENTTWPSSTLSDESSSDDSDNEATAPMQIVLPTQPRSLPDSEDIDNLVPRLIVVNTGNNRSQVLHDSCEHTFINCPRAVEVWQTIIQLIKETRYIIQKRDPPLSAANLLLGYPVIKKTFVANSFIASTVYSIWQARIKLKWDNKFIPPFVIAKKAKAITRDAINSHFEIAKRKGNDALAIFKRNFEDPLLFSINLEVKKIDFNF